MARTKNKESPIIRLTRFEIQTSLQKKAGKEPPKETLHTFYGVDAEGNERLYARLQSDEQFKKWSKTDPLWSKAQSAMFDKLLSNPSTRDVVIQINIKAALDKGDEKATFELWNALSESSKAKFMTKPEA